MQVMHVLDIFMLCKENKKNSSENTVLKMRSQILDKMAVLVHEVSLKKVRKNFFGHMSRKMHKLRVKLQNNTIYSP